jgi:hypothetical protein
MATPAASTARPEEFDRAPAEPLLEAGDRLSRDEFERRYERMPHLKKAELIEGIVYLPSPVRVKSMPSLTAKWSCKKILPFRHWLRAKYERLDFGSDGLTQLCRGRDWRDAQASK